MNVERAMSDSRKRGHYSLKQKMEILRLMDQGENGAELSRKFGISKTTISGWKKSRDSIQEFCETNRNDNRQTLKPASLFKHHGELYKWFVRQKNKGVQVSGPMIKEKALKLNKTLGGDKKFVASDGWINTWKHKYNIRLSEIGMKGTSTDVEENDNDSTFQVWAGSNTDISEDRDELSQEMDSNPGTLQEAINALKEISNLNKDSNQFHTFAHHVAVQLEQLPLESALVLQSDIQNLITRTRLKVLKEQKNPETAENSLMTEEVYIKPEIL